MAWRACCRRLLVVLVAGAVLLVSARADYTRPFLYDDFVAAPQSSVDWRALEGQWLEPLGDLPNSAFSAAQLSTAVHSPGSHSDATNLTTGYGYYEASMRPPPGNNTVSQFYLVGYKNGNYSAVIELRTNQPGMARFVLKTPSNIEDSGWIALGFDPTASYNRYGIDWSDRRIVFYVNGADRMVYGYGTASSFPPLHMGVTLWPSAGFVWTSLGSELWIDYMRYEPTGFSSCCRTTNEAFTDNFDYVGTDGWYAVDGYTPGPWGGSSTNLASWSSKRLALYHWIMKLTIRDTLSERSEGAPYSAGGLMTVRRSSFGYYDTKLRAMKHSGVATVFHLFLGTGDRPPLNAYQTMGFAVFGHNTSAGTHLLLPFDASAAMHRYGLFWNESWVALFVDGQLLHRFSGSFETLRPMNVFIGLWPCNSASSSWPCAPPDFDYSEFVPGSSTKLIEVSDVQVKYYRYSSSGFAAGEPADWKPGEENESSSGLQWWQVILILLACVLLCGCLHNFLCLGLACELYHQGNRIIKFVDKYQKSGKDFKALKEMASQGLGLSAKQGAATGAGADAGSAVAAGGMGHAGSVPAGGEGDGTPLVVDDEDNIGDVMDGGLGRESYRPPNVLGGPRRSGAAWDGGDGSDDYLSPYPTPSGGGVRGDRAELFGTTGGTATSVSSRQPLSTGGFRRSSASGGGTGTSKGAGGFFDDFDGPVGGGLRSSSMGKGTAPAPRSFDQKYGLGRLGGGDDDW